MRNSARKFSQLDSTCQASSAHDRSPVAAPCRIAPIAHCPCPPGGIPLPFHLHVSCILGPCFLEAKLPECHISRYLQISWICPKISRCWWAIPLFSMSKITASNLAARLVDPDCRKIGRWGHCLQAFTSRSFRFELKLIHPGPMFFIFKKTIVNLYHIKNHLNNSNLKEHQFLSFRTVPAPHFAPARPSPPGRPRPFFGGPDFPRTRPGTCRGTCRGTWGGGTRHDSGCPVGTWRTKCCGGKIIHGETCGNSLVDGTSQTQMKSHKITQRLCWTSRTICLTFLWLLNILQSKFCFVFFAVILHGTNIIQRCCQTHLVPAQIRSMSQELRTPNSRPSREHVHHAMKHSGSDVKKLAKND